MTDFLSFLTEQKIEYVLNEPMSKHTTFGIGGPCDVFVTAKTEAEAIAAVQKAEESALPWMILGNGSNLLVRDGGLDGAVISLSGLNGITGDGLTVTCEAGAKLSAACLFAARQGLAGLEFAYGIPGTVGGGLYMNAGAYGGEMKQVVRSAKVLTRSGEIVTRQVEELDLGYRKSILSENGDVVLSVTFGLTKGNPDAVRSQMEELIARRKEKQPLEYHSAGSTFKRPDGHYAAALIEECGLKGKAVGDAEVSRKHAGFIINRGKATCEDVLQLMQEVRDEVYRKTGVTLEPEVIAVGRK